jgi:hypothetical protein
MVPSPVPGPDVRLGGGVLEADEEKPREWVMLPGGPFSLLDPGSVDCAAVPLPLGVVVGTVPGAVVDGLPPGPVVVTLAAGPPPRLL